MLMLVVCFIATPENRSMAIVRSQLRNDKLSDYATLRIMGLPDSIWPKEFDEKQPTTTTTLPDIIRDALIEILWGLWSAVRQVIN